MKTVFMHGAIGTATVLLVVIGGCSLAVEREDYVSDRKDAPAPPSDGGDPSDASARRTIDCLDKTCLLPDETCCINYGDAPVLGLCVKGTCPSPKDSGHDYSTTVKCDDPTDCEVAGSVCCAVHAASCSTAVNLVECRAASACARCNADAGLGRALCRSAVATDCVAPDTCTGTYGTSEPQLADLRFCK